MSCVGLGIEISLGPYMCPELKRLSND